MNAFWVVVSMYPLWSIKESQRFLRMDVNSFPTQEVKAIGLKLAGSLLQVEAEAFGISLTTACLHAWGTLQELQHALKMLDRAGMREEHLLRIL